VAGYNLYFGVASKVYTNMVSFGNVTAASISGLSTGTTYFFTVTAVDFAGLESPYSNETTYTVGTNTPPTISSMPDQTGNVGAALSPVPFTVTDAQTPAMNLTVTAASSNPTLLPNTSIILGGSGTNRTVTLTPAPGQAGTTTIALTVCDQSLCTTTSFQLTINPPPVISLTSPAAGASFSAPAAINLVAAVTANGHSITKVQFLNGTTVLGQTSSAPWTFAWNNVAAGTYALAAVAVYDTGNSLSSSPVNLTVVGNSSPIQSLPAPWQTASIGNLYVNGSATISNNLYSVQGSGNLSSLADNFCFLYQPLSGNGEIRAQITSAQNTGSGDCVGAMIRESLGSGSKYALMGLSPGGPFRWQRRNSTGGNTSSSKAGSATPPNAWTRLVRSGNTLAGYKSTTGTNWTLVSSSTITMATNIYIGFAVASGNTNRLATCLFTNVAVTP
jgi:hypothetical protein